MPELNLSTRRARLRILLCACFCLLAGPVLAVDLPDGVVISRGHGLILTEKTMDGLPPWKTAVMSSGYKRQPGTRNDRVVYSSRNGDPNTDTMLFLPVCVWFKDWVPQPLHTRWIVEGRWATPQGAIMPNNGCFDPAIYVTRDQYVTLGGPSASNAERTWYQYLTYPAVKAFVYVQTYPANPPGKWTLQTIEFHASGVDWVKEKNAEFHFDLAQFIETIGHMAPGAETIEAASKYGFYSTEFYAAAGVEASLLLVPVGRAGKAGRVIYGSLVAGSLALSAYNFTTAETDQERLKSFLDIVMCLSFAHNVLKSAKPKLGLAAPSRLPESADFEDLIGSAPVGTVKLVRRTLGPLPRDLSVLGKYPTPYQFLADGLDELANQNKALADYIASTPRYKKLLSVMSANRQYYVFDDTLRADTLSVLMGDGKIHIRSTMPWTRFYVSAWHETLHTQETTIKLLGNKAKMIADNAMDLQTFLATNAHLIEEEAMIWTNCSHMVKDLETHGASFVSQGVDLAAGEHDLIQLMKQDPVGLGYERVKGYVRPLYQKDIEDELTDLYNVAVKVSGNPGPLNNMTWLGRLGP
jgi:hypothetical protein